MEIQNYIKRIIKPTTYLLLFASFISCLTPINFKADVGNPILVISGQVSTISDRNIVTIGKTTETQRLPIPIEGAMVNLLDQSGNSLRYLESESKPGEYLLKDFSGKPGTSYSLKVVLPNGEVYQSATERIPLEVGTISTDYTVEQGQINNFESDQYLNILVNASLPESKNALFLKWEVEEVFAIVPLNCGGFTPYNPTCFVKQNADPQKIALFNGVDVKTNKIENQLVAIRGVDFSFISRHYFTTYQSSITKESYDYWRKVNILASQVGSIFDAPPAIISGNVVNVNNKSEKVLGYFQATHQTFDRFFVLPENLLYLINSDCECDGRFEYPAYCGNCLVSINSSYERPIWF